MSRVAKNPVILPAGVQASINGGVLTVKGSKGTLSYGVHPHVRVDLDEKLIKVAPANVEKSADAQAGTARANIQNMVTGVHDGYQIKLSLVGVGYRAAAKGETLSLSLGFSHPVEYNAPTGISIETPSQTDILVKGCDKQLVGQVAANIRSFRPPEPYKGKGVRYSDEVIVRKETKKK
ncbi:MAG: 50S ribosomal protein L6 [Methylococcaceae bacterium]|nr:50S ribosomal protein L6 [Methylococcaceae bacterium]